MANWRMMLSVPGTAGMVAFVLTYKLCERGEATLPIYLVDKGVPVSSLAFWNGVVRSVSQKLIKQDIIRHLHVWVNIIIFCDQVRRQYRRLRPLRLPAVQVAGAAAAADAVRRESARAAHLAAVRCDPGLGRRAHRGDPGRARHGHPVLRPVHLVPGGGQPMRGPDDHGLLHGDDDAVAVRGAARADLPLLAPFHHGGARQAHVRQRGRGLDRPGRPRVCLHRVRDPRHRHRASPAQDAQLGPRQTSL